jgi:hypothetical protein
MSVPELGSSPGPGARTRLGSISRLRWIFYLIAVLAVALLALTIVVIPQGEKSGVGSVPLGAALSLGPVASGAGSTTYSIVAISTVPSGIPLSVLGFASTATSGPPPSILEVCVTNSTGSAIGTWSGGTAQGWTGKTTPTEFECTNGTAPTGEHAPGDSRLVASDCLFFYMLGPLNPGSVVTITADGGGYDGSISETYSG